MPQQALASKRKGAPCAVSLECELRIVVWGVHEPEVRGKSKAIQTAGCADCFVTAQAGNGPVQESDAHKDASITPV